QGPGGPVTLPMSTPAVIQVWLQGCQDCMPAFEASKALEARGGMDVGLPVVNVAYGSASTSWAQEFGLDQRLVFDPSGGALVRPLGIGTFTTLVIDEQGYVRLRDRPDNAGYAERVTGAARALLSGPARTTTTP
ncbi:MAG: hypothetical protein AB2A00_34130, partial [Myxococcota bacterium]